MSENRETELVRLWVMNDQGPYGYARKLAREVDPDDAYPAVTLGDQLKDWHEGTMPEVEGVWADLLELAFGRVDWIELAREFLEDVATEQEDDDTDDDS